MHGAKDQIIPDARSFSRPFFLPLEPRGSNPHRQHRFSASCRDRAWLVARRRSNGPTWWWRWNWNWNLKSIHLRAADETGVGVGWKRGGGNRCTECCWHPVASRPWMLWRECLAVPAAEPALPPFCLKITRDSLYIDARRCSDALAGPTSKVLGCLITRRCIHTGLQLAAATD